MQNELLLYAIVRTDIEMPVGKLAAQAGHAFLGTYELCRNMQPDTSAEYRDSDLKKKICLAAEDEAALLRIRDLCEERGIPARLIRDAAVTVFDEPTLTAIGIGPVRRSDLPGYVRHLPTLK